MIQSLILTCNLIFARNVCWWLVHFFWKGASVFIPFCCVLCSYQLQLHAIKITKISINIIHFKNGLVE
jgi:hypothetical protein